jgi:hypothetical protein
MLQVSGLGQDIIALPFFPRCDGAALALIRKLSLPVSRMWQRWVKRSRSAVVILGSPKTVAHSLKLRFVVITARQGIAQQCPERDDSGAFVKFAEQVEE